MYSVQCIYRIAGKNLKFRWILILQFLANVKFKSMHLKFSCYIVQYIVVHHNDCTCTGIIIVGHTMHTIIHILCVVAFIVHVHLQGVWFYSFIIQQARAMQFLPQTFDLLLTATTVKSLAYVQIICVATFSLINMYLCIVFILAKL